MFKTVKRILTPIKQATPFTIYQRTIAITLWIVAILGIGAAVIENINTCSNWMSFFENVFIGIVCSGLVVIITVSIQFKCEQEKYIGAHNNAVYYLLLCIRSCLFETSVSREREYFLLDSLIRECQTYENVGMNLFLYSEVKTNQYFALMISVFNLIAPVIRKNRYVTSLEQYRKEVNAEVYNKAVENALAFGEEYVVQGKNRFKDLKIQNPTDIP